MGIGPNNLGPDGKAGYTSCGHPKKSAGLNKLQEEAVLAKNDGMYKKDGPYKTMYGDGMNKTHGDGLNNLGFIKAETLKKNPNAKTMTVGGETFPIKK